MNVHPKRHFLSKRVSNVLLAILLIPAASFAQQRGAGTPQPLPGAVVRERSRTMDDYDRALNLLKNDAKARAAAAERRRSNFPQINEDFQRIQVIHNEIVRMLRADGGGLNHARLKELSGEMKSRSSRLKTNLGLPDGEKAEQTADAKTTTSPSQSAKSTTPDTPVEPPKDPVKESIVSLHEVVASFVANPLFKNLGVVDVKSVAQASGDLANIIQLSDEIKKSAEATIKATKQK